MIKPEDISQQIKFDAASHTYTDSTGNSLISVSRMISLYKPPFDPDGHITRAVAKRDGKTPQEVKDDWEKMKNDASDRGHDFHSQAESYIKTGVISEGTYKDVVEQFSKISFPGPLKSEIMLFSPTYKLAGTCDVLSMIDNKNCELLDFKTNKQIRLKSKYKTKLLYPLEKYDECEINNYSVQLNLYKFMLEEHGFKVHKITLYHINPETRKIDTYDIPDIKKDIKKLLNHYQSLQAW